VAEAELEEEEAAADDYQAWNWLDPVGICLE
jgi:hypothetical protein